VEVKIGVQHATRELVLDASDSAADVEKMVAKALADDEGILTLTDTKGRTVLVPVKKLAYVEIGTSSVGQVGFRS
jgi:mannose/fructose-specific phosphotransferase system component IIA